MLVASATPPTPRPMPRGQRPNQKTGRRPPDPVASILAHTPRLREGRSENDHRHTQHTVRTDWRAEQQCERNTPRSMPNHALRPMRSPIGPPAMCDGTAPETRTGAAARRTDTRSDRSGKRCSSSSCCHVKEFGEDQRHQHRDRHGTLARADRGTPLLLHRAVDARQPVRLVPVPTLISKRCEQCASENHATLV